MTFLFPLFLIIYEFCTNMSNDMYISVLPRIGEDFSTSSRLTQLTVTAWLAGNAAVQLIVGPLADKYGRRPILFGGGALFLISLLGCAVASSIGIFLFFRFMQGMGVCTMLIAGYATIHDLYDDKRAIQVLAWMGSAALIPAAVGPILGSLFLMWLGWKSIFYFLFLLAALVLLFLWFVMPESVKSHIRKPLNAQSLLALYQKIFCNHSFMTSALAFGMLNGGIMGWLTASPFLLIETMHFTPSEFGWLQVPVFGAYIVGALSVKPLMEKIGTHKLIFLGLTIASISGLCLLLFSLLYSEKAFFFILSMMGYALGAGFAAAPLNRATLNETEEKRGAATAVFYLMMVGSGMVVSLILSIFEESAFIMSLVIAVSVFLSFSLKYLPSKTKAKAA